MKRIRKSHAVVADVHRYFALSIIKDAQDVIRGEIAGVTAQDRYDAICFLRGEMCARWCDLMGIDHGLLVKTVSGENGSEGEGELGG